MVEIEREKRPAGTGYHHDIKPQNLLLLAPEPETNAFGVIQIADFGIGKFHSINSGTGTQTHRGTPTYAAPESKVFEEVNSPDGSGVTKKLNLSRPYDVWSLGCVLMEVIVWLVFGTAGWEQFNATRDGPESCEQHANITDSFFKLDESSRPMIRQVVKDWMEKLRTSPQLQNRDCSLAGLLSIIEKVLNVDPRKRMSARELTGDLTALADRAKKEIYVVSLENQRWGTPMPVSNTPAIFVEDHGTPLSFHFAELPTMSSQSRAETWQTTITDSSLDVAPSTTKHDESLRGDD